MTRIFVIFYLLFGYLICKGQVTRLPLYDDLTVRVDYTGDGRFEIDSMELMQMIALCRELKGQVGVGQQVVNTSSGCDSLLQRSVVLQRQQSEMWDKRVELLQGRGDWYMERMKEEVKAGKGKAVRNAIWAGLGGAVVGLVVGAVVW